MSYNWKYLCVINKAILRSIHQLSNLMQRYIYTKLYVTNKSYIEINLIAITLK